MITYKNKQNKCIYNVQAISFLLDSFIDLVESYGQKKETVMYYKQQVNGMIMNNTININPASWSKNKTDTNSLNISKNLINFT